MQARQMTVSSSASSNKWIYRVGAISAIIFGIAYLAIIGLFVPMGALPTGAERWLVYMSSHLTLWWAISALSVLTDLLLIPVALALYLALKETNREMMLLATACTSLFIILDLAVTWTNYATLIALSSQYASAVGEAQKASLVIAATYPSIVLESNILFIYNTLTLTIGILITSLVMRRSKFDKAITYTGLATGFFGIISVASAFFTDALDFTIIIASLLTMIWVFLAGIRLLRLERQ